MIFDDLITPMINVCVRDAVAEFIAKERDDQKSLAAKQGKDQKFIEQNIDFNVFPSSYRIPDISECPCVFVYFDNGNFDPGLSYSHKNWSNTSLNLTMFASGANEALSANDEDEINGKPIEITADMNADVRLNYLLSQVYKILSSEEGWYKGTDGIVQKSTLESWQRIAMPEMANEARSLMGTNLKYNLGFFEPTELLKGVDIKEFYTKLKIRKELIDPFVQKIIMEVE